MTQAATGRGFSWAASGKPSGSLAEPMTPGVLARSFLLFVRRNLRLIALVALAVAAFAFGVAAIFLRQYSATAVVMIDPRATRVTEKAGVLANIGSDFNAIESIVQVAKSDGFVGGVVDQLDLAHNPVFAGKGATPALLRQSTIQKLSAHLTVARRGATYVIDVTVKSPSAEESAKVANGVAQRILDDQASLRSGLSASTAREIEKRLTELRVRVNRAERAVAEFKAQIKVTDAGQGNTLLERRIVELNQQMVLAASRTAEARARYDLLRKAGASAGDNLPQDVQSSVLSGLRAEYARLSRQAADQATVLGPRHPEAISLKAQIGDIRQQIAAEISRLISAARNDFREEEQREAELTRQLKATQAESGELGPQMVRLTELEREAKAEREVFEELLSRQRELAQVNGLEPSDVRIVSPAVPPTSPAPGKVILAMASMGLGLAAGLAAAGLHETRSTTLRTSAQAASLGGVEALVFLPMAPAPSDAARRAIEAPDVTAWLSEVCRGVIQPGADADGAVVLVSSSVRGEGRSTVAINLAAFLARGGDRVLLIEADRAEHVKKPPHGLLDILAARENLTSALIEQPTDGYTLLPFGGRDAGDGADIGALMRGATLRALLKVARRWFDVVIIDGPPALEAPQAPFLAEQADRLLFVVEWDKTHRSDVGMALDRLDAVEAAVVFNKTDTARLRLYDPEQARVLESRKRAA